MFFGYTILFSNSKHAGAKLEKRKMQFVKEVQCNPLRNCPAMLLYKSRHFLIPFQFAVQPTARAFCFLQCCKEGQWS